MRARSRNSHAARRARAHGRGRAARCGKIPLHARQGQEQGPPARAEAHILKRLLAATLCGAALACGGSPRLAVPSALTPGSLTLAGEATFPPLERFPPIVGLPFGGISGLAALADGRWIAVSDERDGSRIYRLRISGEGTGLRVAPEDVIGLETGGAAPAVLDPEAVAITPERTLIIASEGVGDAEPRQPPALLEYELDGRFVRQLPLRDRFLPTVTGPLTRGARDNAALESLTIAADADRLYTAFESALVQDGEPATIGRGTTVRILEYERSAGRYTPAREFAYAVEPIAPAPFAAAIIVSGLVELLALGGDDLLALERTYLAERSNAAGRGQALNRIRLYRVSLAGATDVSAHDGLAGAAVTPVRKRLLLDLSDVAGLSAELATLENFEGLAPGPTLADGSRSLLLVSDDNFRASQRTSFLLFRVGGRK